VADPNLPRETLATEHSGAPTAAPVRRYLAVFGAESSSVVPLPEAGELVIGRGDEAGLRLADGKISRKHAKLAMAREHVVLTDLESQNGTFVNGERLSGSRLLVSGDLIDIGKSAIVFHSQHEAPSASASTSFEALRRELVHEIERAARGSRPLALASLALDGASESALAALERDLLGLERAAPDGAERVLVLLPELGASDAETRARSLAEVLADRGIGAKVGLALHPKDGCDADTLLSAARGAATESAPRQVRGAQKAFRVLELGESRVLLADPAMAELYALIERLAASDLPVLIHGETGTGKELAARALHHLSKRKDAKLVAVNCAALSESLVESELFGHEKGAFTGAAAAKPGLFEAADGGSLFLDEVGELPLAAQAKLLRVLDTHKVVRVGDVNERAVDVRVIGATNKNLEHETAAGRFRQDLFFRLSGATLWVPPLADRPRELGLLAERFLDAARARLGRAPMRISDEALRALAAHLWPGNVRELKNVMEFCAAAFDEPVLEGWQLGERLGRESPPPAAQSPAPAPSAAFRPIEDEIHELTRRRISEALAVSDGNQRRAAQLIGMPLRTFVSKLAQYGLRNVTARSG
jgi:two-component system, NtrC family, response regulator AtoC